MNTIGERIKATLFGESHGQLIGIVIDGIPSGINLNTSLIDKRLEERRPKPGIGTTRVEKDEYEIVSGYYQEKTTGAPLTIIIKNQDIDSSAYDNLKNTPRPSHADYPAFCKYLGYNDPRGGGVFSGRMTVLFVVLGAISEQLLEKAKITVISHLLKIKHINDTNFDQTSVNNEYAQNTTFGRFPVINSSIEPDIAELIEQAKNNKDSLGGLVESAIVGLPAGLGEPLFSSIESRLSQLLFSIPGVKGIEFGSGFKFADMYGSEANDEYQYENGRVVTDTNHNGGILGGLSTGMPIILRLAVKPTPSIGLPQRTVDLKSKADTVIEIKGRHDPAIVLRVVPIVNALLNFGILDLLCQFHEQDWLR
ncbi:MAG: chorismate synthase [Candidatus Izemoplasmatales bacterium]|nr:chorismate synthase [Candidatus Izemoplasmatales bacterium]